MPWGDVQLCRSPTAPACPPLLQRPPPGRAAASAGSVQALIKPKPPQQCFSYLLLEKGGNTVFDNYCFFHLTGCKLVNFFL